MHLIGDVAQICCEICKSTCQAKTSIINVCTRSACVASVLLNLTHRITYKLATIVAVRSSHTNDKIHLVINRVKILCDLLASRLQSSFHQTSSSCLTAFQYVLHGSSVANTYVILLC